MSDNQVPPNPLYVRSWRAAAERDTSMKGRVRSAIRSSALSLLGSLKWSSDRAFLRGIYCHYVFDDQRARFEQIIASLCRIGTFIDTATFLDMLSGSRQIDGPYFHLSFDDGFRNIYQNAFPTLRKYKVPALVFVPTALVGASWSEARAYCIATRYRGTIELTTWDELREMIDAGHEVGSHTRTHPRLSVISSDEEQLADEVIGSKSDVELQLGVECRYISWPFGSADAVDATTLATIRRAGYRACFGAFRGPVQPGETDMFRIPRHHFEVQWPMRHIRYFALGGQE